MLLRSAIEVAPFSFLVGEREIKIRLLDLVQGGRVVESVKAELHRAGRRELEIVGIIGGECDLSNQRAARYSGENDQDRFAKHNSSVYIIV